MMLFPEVDFGQNKYEFYLDMWGIPKSMWDEVGDRQLIGPKVIKESEENVK